MDVDSALQNATTAILSENATTDAAHVSDQPVANEMTRAFFKVDDTNLTNKTVDKLNEIWDWAKTQADDAENDLDVLQVLRDARFKLGANPLDQSHLDHFYQYVKLSREASKLSNQMKAMEK